jgi:hypothetical protein
MAEVEQENRTPEYLKGFNYGYMVAEHIPELAHQLRDSVGTSDRFEGLRDGIAQFDKEKELDRKPDWLKKSTRQSKDKSRNRESEKDRD